MSSMIRRTLAVQLDQRKPEEKAIFDYGAALKKEQKWAATFRDAVRLIKDLRAGNLDVLFELFPWIERALYDALEASQKPPSDDSSDTGSKLLAEIQALRKEVKEAQQPGGHYQRPALASGSLSAPSISDDIDNDLSMTQRLVGEEHDYMPNWNLPIQIAASTGNYASLTPEMIWYGIRTGSINAEKALKAGQLQPGVIAEGVEKGKLDVAQLPKEFCQQMQPPQNKGPKEIAGANIPLPPPRFDDIEELDISL